MSERRIFEVSFPVGHALEKERKPISFALIAHAGLIPLTSKAKKKKKMSAFLRYNGISIIRFVVCTYSHIDNVKRGN